MPEAIIAKRRKEISGASRSVNLLMVASDTFTMPSNVENNSIDVTLVGGSSDTAVGETVKASVELQDGELVNVYIGEQGTDGGSGSPTSFGTYAMANGGSGSLISNKVDIDNAEGGYVLIEYTIKEVGTNE